MNRRTFLRTAAAAGVAAPVVAAGYGLAESTDLHIDRQTVAVPNLPAAFRGLTVALVTDIHHGPFTSQDDVSGVVRTTLALEPDLIVLGGDYHHADGKYIPGGFDRLAPLAAPLGVFGVLGNHDNWRGRKATQAGMKKARIEELTNAGVWLRWGGARLRLAGVDDLWTGKPDVAAAVGDATVDDAVLLVSHNPDLAERLTDRRVGLVLSGHTHGGQVAIPGYGPPVLPSSYGMKYARGLVDAPLTRVYVSAGTGMSGIGLRLNCPPEVSLLTLA
jgi:predicted MPP superfamily phosphohydrolase